MKYFFALFLTVAVTAQNLNQFQVSKLELPDRFFHPKFIDSDNLLLTGESYKGLFLFNMESGELKTITEESGAGYGEVINDGEIFYRSYVIDTGRKFYFLKKYSLVEEKTEIIESGKRRISIDEILKFAENRGSRFAIVPGIYTSNENSDLLLYVDGTLKKLNPFGEGIYVWAELSPSKDKILFTYGAKGSFVCNLKGEILYALGENAHYAKWLPESKRVVFMRDIDDGHIYLESDIFIYDLESGAKENVTATPDIIEMYPEVSPDGGNIAFHDLEGNIYIARIKKGGRKY